MFTAATTPTHAGACGRLVLVEPAMASTTPRLMVAPPGARLPPGVHEVAPVIVVPVGPHRGRLPRAARAVVAAAAGAGDGRTTLGLSCFSTSALAAVAPVGVCFAGDGTRFIGLGTGAPRTRPIGAAGSSTVGEQRHMFGFPATATATATARCATPTGSRLVAAAIGVAGPTAAERDVFGTFPASVTGRGASVARACSTPIVAVTVPGAGIGGSGAVARVTPSAMGPHMMTAAGLCFGDSVSTGFIGFAAASPSSRSGRNYVPRVLDLGDGDGEEEEDPSDEHSYQQAHRQIRDVVYLVCLRRRVEVASDLGLVQSGRERRLMLQEIGMISAAAPVYHWVISRSHGRLSDIVGADLHNEIFSATPSIEKEFKWIVQKDSGIIVSITTLMAEIQYSIMHNETWRAVVRDRPVYDMCPLFLDKLAGCVAEFSTNIALACFRRPFPPITQRMVENHGLAVVHLYEILLDLYEVMFDEQADDPKKTRELLMRFGILFVQDVHPQDYICGAVDADADELLLLLNTVTREIRNFRGSKWM